MAKTTLNIPDPLFRELKRRAISRGETMSNLVAEYIRRGLEQKPKPQELPPLPAYDGGPFLIDVSDRDSLYGLLDEDKDWRDLSPSRKHGVSSPLCLPRSILTS